MALPVINTREDLDALQEQNPAQYLEFMAIVTGKQIGRAHV